MQTLPQWQIGRKTVNVIDMPWLRLVAAGGKIPRATCATLWRGLRQREGEKQANYESLSNRLKNCERQDRCEGSWLSNSRCAGRKVVEGTERKESKLGRQTEGLIRRIISA